MRTLATQVKLRRLIRTFGESWIRLASEPLERGVAGSVVDRLLELSGVLRVSWRRENLARPLEAALEGFVAESMRMIELGIAGLHALGHHLPARPPRSDPRLDAPVRRAARPATHLARDAETPARRTTHLYVPNTRLSSSSSILPSATTRPSTRITGTRQS